MTVESARKIDTSSSGSDHIWRFFRVGGFEQVRLETPADLAALPSLDQKLWVALSCPTRGIELDPRTLDLIDADGDGRLRANELLDAVRWTLSVLTDATVLFQPGDSLDLALINGETATGQQVLTSARRVLEHLGEPEATAISLGHTTDTVRIFSNTLFNGDGIIPVSAAGDDAAAAAAIADILGLQTVPAMDRSGQPGITQANADAAFAETDALLAWTAQSDDPASGLLPLGAGTAAAADALTAIEHKVADYFLRCHLAAYDPAAADALAEQRDGFLALAGRDLSVDVGDLAAFPLARPAAGRALPLGDGINPAWAGPLAAFISAAVTPLLGAREALSEADWQQIGATLAPFRAWMAAKPVTAVEGLAHDRLTALADPALRANLTALFEKDLAEAPVMAAIADVERLLRYRRDLVTLLNNVITFRDFYSRRQKAAFQIGTLYLDGRSCDLVVHVDDPAKHATLATLAGIYLVYCSVTRKGSDDRKTIAAAFTAGDGDQIMVGRNGVFYDRQGRDWDATVIRVLEHPISLRQAFYAPYKHLVRMVGDQIEKIAQAHAKSTQDSAAKALDAAGKPPAPPAAGAAPAAAAAAPAPATPAPFDIAKAAGIFAAAGLAVGAIGTAAASILTGFLGLLWWQMPLAIVGILAIISGPNMILAFLKLRHRTLGPILDANGWAVNARAAISIPFGTTLTELAVLPKGSERSLSDPYADQPVRWKRYAVIAVIIIVAIAVWRLGFGDYLTRHIEALFAGK